MTRRQDLEDPAEKVWKLFEGEKCPPEQLQNLSKAIRDAVEATLRKDLGFKPLVLSPRK
jgi:hypothetical protein